MMKQEDSTHNDGRSSLHPTQKLLPTYDVGDRLRAALATISKSGLKRHLKLRVVHR